MRLEDLPNPFRVECSSMTLFEPPDVVRIVLAVLRGRFDNLPSTISRAGLCQLTEVYIAYDIMNIISPVVHSRQ
jgi:hypothetical protein